MNCFHNSLSIYYLKKINKKYVKLYILHSSVLCCCTSGLSVAGVSPCAQPQEGAAKAEQGLVYCTSCQVQGDEL